MMHRQLYWLGINFKVAHNTVAIAVKKKSFKCLSTSQMNHQENPKNTPALSFLRREFFLPNDYFDRRSTGMVPCKFAGKIHVVKDEEDEQRLVRDGVVCKDFERQKALGMDIEYSVSYKRSMILQVVSLIQVASKENAVLWKCSQGNLRDKLPPYLLSIINGDVLKVGHGLIHDIVLLQKNYGECTNNIVDTLTWAKEMNCYPLNLRALCAIFLHQRLSKDLRNSDWSREVLTEKELIYAATDAWASLRVHEEMKRIAEVLRIPLSLPLKSTLDVFQLRQVVKINKKKRQRENSRKRKRALTE